MKQTPMLYQAAMSAFVLGLLAYSGQSIWLHASFTALPLDVG